jgi:hypothetical protein
MFVEVADMITIADAEFSPNILYSLIGMEVPFLPIFIE